MFSRIFNDFGSEFIVLDKDGEEMQEVMIENIDLAGEKTVVTLLPGFKHRFQDGDVVKLREVKGMLGKENGSSINGSEFKVKIVNPQSFELEGCDLRKYSPYEGNGIAKQIKVPLKMNF